MKASKTSEEIEIHPADPETRKRAFWLILVSVVIAVAFAIGIHFHGEKMGEWAEERMLELAEQPPIMFLVAFVFAIPLVGATIPMFRQAGKIVKSERIPPPDAKVVKDTPVITGSKAVRQGRGLQVMAVLMALFGLLVPFGVAIILMLLQKGT
ncbi:MAG TPA: hypothetical protein VJ984_16295 [Xanthomonadales bacterium]|nr:hypothetical protein [Xanthomonadales bacterium]